MKNFTRRSHYGIAFLLIGLNGLAVGEPVSYVNCGAASDILSIQRMDEQGATPDLTSQPFPIYTRASFDPATGRLTRLRSSLLALNWVFELNGLDQLNTMRTGTWGRNASGFVALPTSWLTQLSPAMLPKLDGFLGLPGIDWQATSPLAYAGPIDVGTVIPALSSSDSPVTLTLSGSATQEITTAKAFLSLQFNGKSGFPVPAVNGSYGAQMKTVLPNGSEAFCLSASSSDSPMVVVDRIPFRGVKIQTSSNVVGVEWRYGDAHSPWPFSWPIGSAAMSPAVLQRLCNSDPSTNVPAVGVKAAPVYEAGQFTWSFSLSRAPLTSSCYDISIASGLTGQVDGPFRVVLP